MNAYKKRIGDLEGQAETLCVMGAVYSSLGQKDKAQGRYRDAISIRKRLGVQYEDIEHLMAKVCLDNGDLAEAEELLGRGNHAVFLGALALAKLDYSKAREKFQEQLNASLQNHNVYGLFEAHTGLGTAYEGLGEFKKAADHFLQAINVTEEMRDAIPEAQRSSFYDVTAWYFRRIYPYEGLARVLLHSGSTVESLKWAESTKARAFAESISRRSGDIDFDIPKNVMDRDREINDRLAAASKGLQDAIAHGNQESIGVLEGRVREFQKIRNTHVDNLRKEYPAFAAAKYPQPFSIENAALKDDERVLEFEVTDSGICIYLTLGKNIVKTAFRPLARKELERLVRSFREPMEVVPGQATLFEKLKAFDFAAGSKLAELLLGDVLEVLPRDAQLIIIPDDILGVLPFEMLVLNSDGSVSTEGKTPQIRGCEFFGDRNPISYYQSITALTLARNVPLGKAQDEELLVFADPVFQLKDERVQKAPQSEKTGSDARFYSQLMATMEDAKGTGVRFNRLPLTGELASSLGQTFAGKVQTYSGLEASKENLLKKIAPKLNAYNIVIFATHGYFGTKIPGINEPVLVLTLVPPGTDGFLRMSEVMGLSMKAEMVVLTACQSGLGKAIYGEGTMGMGRAFQYAGARSVLMSLWSVAEKSSVMLMENFFKFRKDGKSKAESLKMARDEIRKAGYDHPFYWASFILVGETN